MIKPSYVYDEVAVIKQYDIPFGEGTLASFVSEESGVYKYKPGKEYKGIFTAIDLSLIHILISWLTIGLMYLTLTDKM